ncbi:MAG TPA: hypothetical protein VEC99_11815 [Clostridia bacterium]|nr:hypothetical protein [Clostridia bacterium]
MKPKVGHAGGSVQGHALLVVLVSAAVCLTLLAGTASRTITASALNERNNHYTAGIYAAEAATEKVLARMKSDFLVGDLTYVTNNLPLYRGLVPTASEDPYWGNYVFSDAQGKANSTYVSCLSSLVYTNLQSQYTGLFGWQTKYRILSNASEINSRHAITNAVQQDIEMDSIPVFQFAIFYNGLLEFTWAAPMTVNGRTHANSHIFVGSAWDLIFNSTVTAAGMVTKTNWDGHTMGQYTGQIRYNGSPGYSTNCQILELPIGTNNTAAAVREIIQMPPGARPNGPPTGEDVDSAMGSQRYYNKAKIVLVVSNNTVTTTLKTQSEDTAPTVITANYSSTDFSQVVSNFPFLTLTNKFTDQREGKQVLPTELDISKLNRWLTTNSQVNAKFPNSGGVYNAGVYPNILYVADNRAVAANQLTAIRLINGSMIPTNMAPSGQPTGFTVATPNPLYIKGHYNCPNPAHRGTTNTTQTFPASLVSDALTILSQNWNDAKSAGSFTSRDAVSTTINAAILTGIVYSTGRDEEQFSGGVMNLPRLLEDWGNGSSSIVLTLNTSIVNFYDSIRATNQFQNPGIYYYAPVRQFSFDQNLRNYARLPPGTPTLGTVFRSKWTVPPPNTTTYAGF